MLFLCLLGEYLKEPLIKAIKIICATGSWHDRHRHRHTPLGLDFGWHRMDSDVCMHCTGWKFTLDYCLELVENLKTIKSITLSFYCYHFFVS